MKKVFKLAAIAAIATFTIVACNNNQPNTEDSSNVDTTMLVAEDELVAEPAEALDTTPVAVADEKPATEAKKATNKKPAAKPVTKKVEEAAKPAEQKVEEVKKDADNKTLQTTPIKRKQR